MKEEIVFTYNMLMSYHYQNSNNVEKFVAKALEIKSNHRDARSIMEMYLRKKFFLIHNANAYMDTVIRLEERLQI